MSTKEQAHTAGHTPGPWRVEDQTTLVWGNCNPDDHSTYGMGYPIAEARINPSGNWSTGPYADEGEANARLIAAAPGLLSNERKNLATMQATRLRLREYGKSTAELDEAIRQTEEVLARATGEAR